MFVCLEMQEGMGMRHPTNLSARPRTDPLQHLRLCYSVPQGHCSAGLHKCLCVLMQESISMGIKHPTNLSARPRTNPPQHLRLCYSVPQGHCSAQSCPGIDEESR